ncbi:MAG: C1 family peptidase [Candidatus Sericytochromatia bacterium]
MLKRLFLVALATLNIAMMTGCGSTAMPVPGVVRASVSQPTVFVKGKKRTLGYDLNRYKRVQAPKARLRQVAPVGTQPTRVDMRAEMSPVVDQYDLGACTAFAVGKGLREYMLGQRGERTALSALFLYYETRRIRGTVDIDSGATITDTMQALAKAGIAPEAAWPYDPMVFDQKPPSAAYKAGADYRLSSGVQLAGLSDIKAVLAKGQVVAFGMRVFHRFRDIGKDGKLELPQNGDIYVGGHAVAVVGYDDQKKHLIVKNSWGTAWGDEGYFYMPYAYVTPENVMDIWTAR